MKKRWHDILGWRELDKISWRRILMWQEESLFYIRQDIGDYIGDNQRGFGVVKKLGAEKSRLRQLKRAGL